MDNGNQDSAWKRFKHKLRVIWEGDPREYSYIWDDLREQACDIIRNCDSDTYNYIFYEIGEYDFNRYDERSVSDVADLFLLKNSPQNFPNCYQVEGGEERLYHKLYKYPFEDESSVPEYILEIARCREELEENTRKERKMLYIPQSPDLDSLASRAAALSMTCPDAFRRHETFFEQAKREWAEEEHKVLVGILFFLIIYEFLCHITSN